jgi:hypothetical protein
MNKTEARFCTSSGGIASYFLWHSVYPERIAEYNDTPTLLYFKERDYNKFMVEYWQGKVIPICELAECLMVTNRIMREREIDPEWFIDMWDEIYDIRTDYAGKGQLTFMV